MRTVYLYLLVPVLLAGCEDPCVDDAGRFNWECAGAKFKGEAYCCDSFAAIDFNQDGYDDVLIGGTGGGYLFYGPVEGTKHLSDADVKFGTTGAASVASAGDVNGDGQADILLVSERRVKLVLGPFDGPLPAATATINGSVTADYRRFKAVGVGDVNGDGYDDILIGTSFRVTETNCKPSLLYDCYHYEGETYLFLGPLSGSLWLSDADDSLKGREGGHQVAAAGDFNGDGLKDILVGVSRWEHRSGAVFLFLGPVVGSLSFVYADAVFKGSSSQRVGSSLSPAGDVNNDGYDDILIGSIYNERAYLVRGPVVGTYQLSEARTRFVGGYSEYNMGREFAEAGDVDGDGLDDVLISECSDEGDWVHGTTYLVRSPASGVVDLSNADVRFKGHSGGVAGAGDVNGDGLADFLIGSPGRQEAYLIYGW